MRKYDWKRTDFALVSGAVQGLLLFVTEYLYEDHEVAPQQHVCPLNHSLRNFTVSLCILLMQGIYVALKDLLDANLPFYSKYCFLAVSYLRYVAQAASLHGTLAPAKSARSAPQLIVICLS